MHVAAQFVQSCPNLWDAMVCSPLGFSVHWILQARILEQVAMPCSSRSSWTRDQTCISCVFCVAGGFFTLIHWGSPCILLLYLNILKNLWSKVYDPQNNDFGHLVQNIWENLHHLRLTEKNPNIFSYSFLIKWNIVIWLDSDELQGNLPICVKLKNNWKAYLQCPKL